MTPSSHPPQSSHSHSSSARNTYMDASVATASPARLLVMLLERLVLDVTRAAEAQRDGSVEEAHRQLVHAQEIVLELRASLDVETWDGGEGLASIYDFLHTPAGACQHPQGREPHRGLPRSRARPRQHLARGCHAERERGMSTATLSRDGPRAEQGVRARE